MIYGSVCSGIEAATVAWEPLGWKASFFSEIEKFPRAVLEHHYPDTPLHGDFTTIKENEYEPIDLLVGGTPCQSFSVAGLRKGMDDERGNLALEYLRLAQRLGPRWLVWENVPGVLSSNGGRDFGSFLGALVELGYGWSYRVLDAQYFGVPQRRRRVFVVAYLGGWRPAAAVLFERESLSRNTPPSRKKREGITGGFEVGPGSNGFTDLAPTLDARCKDGPIRNQIRLGVISSYSTSGAGYWRDGIGALRGREQDSHENVVAIKTANTKANGSNMSEEGVMYTLDTSSQPHAVAVMENQRAEIRLYGQTDALTRGGGKPGQGYAAAFYPENMQVRRLTPIECERLQGFKDNYTFIPRYAKPRKSDLEDMARYCGFESVGEYISYGPPGDGPRYKALGNSMAVPVMRWIGERIKEASHG